MRISRSKAQLKNMNILNSVQVKNPMMTRANQINQALICIWAWR